MLFRRRPQPLVGQPVPGGALLGDADAGGEAAEVKGAAAKDDAVLAWMAASVREIEATQSGERTGLEVAGGQVEAPRGASERTERSATSS